MRKGLFVAIIITGCLSFTSNASAWYSYKSTSYSYTFAPTRHDTLSNADDAVAVVNLPWSFQFYGNTFNQITISTNGFIVMGNYSGSSLYSNRKFEYDGQSGIPNGIIAPLWDDWNPSAGGSIYYGTVGSAFVVEWWGVYHYGTSSNGVSFQVKLFQDGNIEFHYLDTDTGNDAYDGGKSASIGYQEASNTVGYSSCYESSYCAPNSSARGYSFPGRSALYAKAYDGFYSPARTRPSLKFWDYRYCFSSTSSLYATTSYGYGGWGRGISSSSCATHLLTLFTAATDGYDVSVIPNTAPTIIDHGTYRFYVGRGFTPKPSTAPRWTINYGGSYEVPSGESKLDYWMSGSWSDKTVVFITGFDPLNEDSTASYLVLMGDLARQLLAEGYDIAIGKFGDGNKRLNSLTYEVGLWVNDAYNRQGSKVQVGGISMGGILLRDAIGENQFSIRSKLNAWYSIDSPQMGANLGRGYRGIQNLLFCNKRGSPQDQQLASNPAADMMYNRITSCSCDDEPENSTCSSTTSYHDGYYGTVAWDTTVPRYAFAFGDAYGSTYTTMSSSRKLYDFEYSAWTCSEDRDWNAGQRDCAAGSKYITFDMVATDDTHWWCEDFTLRLKFEPAFINVDSALGLETGLDANAESSSCSDTYSSLSPWYWNGWISNTYNEYHSVVTSRVINQALTWIRAHD